MPSEFARNLAQTLEREARVRVGPPTRRGATPRREPKGGDTEKRVVGDGPKRGESRPTDKRVRDGTRRWSWGSAEIKKAAGKLAGYIVMQSITRFVSCLLLFFYECCK